jgi:hypothetical protein
MDVLTYTVLTDGPSDRRLIPVINWCLSRYTSLAVTGNWADLYYARPRPNSLRERIQAAAEYYPSSILFVHRDAETATRADRVQEIRNAAHNLALPPVIEVVTVRMQEAWFLFDEQAIRTAASNPNGQEPLNLPALATLETLPDPKQVLFTALEQASGLEGRHLRRFNPNRAAHRISELIEDFSPLIQLPAFEEFDRSARLALV